MRLAELCGRVGLQLGRDASVRTLGFIETPLDGRLVFAADEANLRRALAADGIAAIATTPELAALADEIGLAPQMGLALAQNPRLSFAELHNDLAAISFYGAPRPTIVHASATIHPTAHIDEADVVVGPNCHIGPKASILAGTTLQDGVRVMAGAVLSGSGFQVVRDDRMVDLVHVGRLEVGTSTVIMANAVVARAVFPVETKIGADCRIGNNTFVSHNCQIGDRCLIGHGAVVAGGCVLDDDVVLGPGVTCIDRRRIGRGARVTAGATVARDVPAGTRVSGPIARRHLGAAGEDQGG